MLSISTRNPHPCCCRVHNRFSPLSVCTCIFSPFRCFWRLFFVYRDVGECHLSSFVSESATGRRSSSHHRLPRDLANKISSPVVVFPFRVKCICGNVRSKNGVLFLFTRPPPILYSRPSHKSFSLKIIITVSCFSSFCFPRYLLPRRDDVQSTSSCG